MTAHRRLALLVAALALLAGACTPDQAPVEATPTSPDISSAASIPCGDGIDVLSAPPDNFEVVLDVVALPTRTVLTANDSGEPGWLFAKQGLVVYTGAAVDLVVPADATDHVKIGWGSPGPRGSALRVAGCSGPWWLVFAGGYWVDAPACVPLIVRSGGRETRVRIPVGTACT